MTTLATPGTTSSAAPTSSVVASTEPGGSGSASKSAVGGGEQISAQEAKDRKEIEAVWLRYWTFTGEMQQIAPEDRRDRYSAILAEPLLSREIDLSRANDEKNIDTYGEVKHQIRWTVAVDGQDSAVLTDCQDQSEFGAYNTKTSKAITKGPSRVNQQATFIRTTDGWRLSYYFDPKGTTCTR